MLVKQVVSVFSAGIVEAVESIRRNSSFLHTIRILVVDDFEPWRTVIRRILASRSYLQIVGEACDGQEAVQKARDLQPELILMDIAMPCLNGVEAARKIREIAADSKILFLSQEYSQEFAQETVNVGAQGYVIKRSAQTDLLPAIEAVIQGKHFFSPSLEV